VEGFDPSALFAFVENRAREGPSVRKKPGGLLSSMALGGSKELTKGADCEARSGESTT